MSRSHIAQIAVPHLHIALPTLLLHEHLFFMVNDQFSHALPFSAPRLYLAFGVTTIRTAGTDHPYLEINLRRAIERGEVPGPEIHLTGPYLTVLQAASSAEIALSNPEEARAAVRVGESLLLAAGAVGDSECGLNKESGAIAPSR